MIELACPSCGRAGSIPREKINTRLTCKKCHIVFHVNTTGRALVGEPHVEPPKAEPRHHEGLHLPSFESLEGLTESLPTVSPRSLGVGAAALSVVVGLFLFLTKPPESLADSAQRTAERFANDDLIYLKQIATSETIDDVVRWFDAVHPQLVKNREQWKSREARIQVMVIGEDHNQRKGEAQAFIYPAGEAGHVNAIATAAASTTTTATSAQQQPIDLRLHWVLDRKGTWKLDGLQTFQAASRPL
ncbi:zinc ribbon domain-containing protein [Singulisphaera acidiphila]|uniref:Uncharacterized protein n=1 Tax=Singulisphaera acidiphila (strain ATCC BAA-1392 / DSM 18658 / VKM B-2454 / MOB10) TaxID=886293 RepID=L0DN40_SINAD|nr:hypothetical protein [Singulisphaera acidiphila]AGA30258.1 hypothetical protein Sinac_6156 [Singulisphaera acidiphila DSM 18658]